MSRDAGSWEAGTELPGSYRFLPGRSPLLVSMPHVGTELPAQIKQALTAMARTLPDNDWYVDRLYDFVLEEGAGVLMARYSRYVIDLNRPPDDASLYPGQTHTGLCPVRSFSDAPLYLQELVELPAAEVQFRREQYWHPYHAALAAAIEQTRRRWGCALLLDAHSIRSRVPRLFEGRLPDINLGTDDGRSCDERLVQPLLGLLRGQPQFSHVLNARFKGGYITRHYGRPAAGVHALQIELAQDAYMDEEAVQYTAGRAAPLRVLLRAVVRTLLAQVPVLVRD